jgi:hypothetical protein
MISLFSDGYPPPPSSPSGQGDISHSERAYRKATEPPAPQPPTHRPPGPESCGGRRDGAGPRAGVLRRLGLGEDVIAAELGLGQAEVRFLLKLEQIRLTRRTGEASEPKFNFPQAEAAICDSSTVHRAERGYRP